MTASVRNGQNARHMYLVHVTSLYVRDRRHTSARQARQHGQEKRPRRPAWLDEVHRASALSHAVSTCSTAIAPRSAFDRASPLGCSRAHIHHRRRRRWNAALPLYRVCNTRTLHLCIPVKSGVTCCRCFRGVKHLQRFLHACYTRPPSKNTHDSIRIRHALLHPGRSRTDEPHGRTRCAARAFRISLFHVDRRGSRGSCPAGASSEESESSSRNALHTVSSSLLPRHGEDCVRRRVHEKETIRAGHITRSASRTKYSRNRSQSHGC